MNKSLATFSTVQVRLPATACAELETRAEKLRALHPGLRVSIASVVRDLVLREINHAHEENSP